jgi:large subunit ribosomal protein L35
MIKTKTHSGAKKRFKKLKSGKVKAFGAYHRHLLTKKSRKSKRNQRKSFVVHANDQARLVALLPY